MGSLKAHAALAGFLAVAASSMTAHAADLLPPMPMPEAPFEFDGGGWYLRGDVGVGHMDFRRTDATDASTPPVPYTYGRIQDHVSDTVFFGAGVGYQVNSWLRFDATGEYRTQSDWRFIAQDLTSAPAGYDLLSGKFSTIVGLANVYFDLGHWYGFTPFIGGGVGVAHHMFQDVTDQGLGAFTGGAAGVAGGFGYGRARDTTNFAWAVHAGVGYDVTPNLKLELAYRYLNMGDVRTGTVGCLPGCALLTNYRLRDVDSHDFKIGMRWMFNEPVPAPEPPPLIRKY